MKKVLSLVILLMAAVAAQAQNELYVYQHSGVTDTLQLADVTGISHERTDLDGRVCDDYVVMSVSTGQDGIRRYLLAALDSVVMQRDGRRIRLTRFVGYQDGRGGSGLLKSRGRAKTSLDGDFMADSGEIVDFYWSDDDNIFVYSEDDERMHAADSVDYHEPDKAVADFFFKTGNITGDEIPVYYLGQASPGGKQVRISKDQSQAEPNNSLHIGRSGDCGTAIATKPEGQDHYRFELEHQAAYLCFLPYIGNDLGRTVLRKITVRSDRNIAGVFNLDFDSTAPADPLDPEEGGGRTASLTLVSDPSTTVTLTTGGESGFILPKTAAPQMAAFMVIAPQTGTPTRLTCEFTVYDTELQSEGVYTKMVDLEEVEANKVYVVKANCNNYVVDLGLPMKFLNHNMGAFAPEDYGGYYAYGELTDKAYCWSDNYTYQNTAVGPEIRLTDKDVAHVRLGQNFSIPSSVELNMLVDSLSTDKWVWRTVNGNNGYLITGNNGNHLFLPAGGYRDYRMDVNPELNSRGCYRTSTLVRDGVKRNWYMNFYSYSHYLEPSATDIYLGESIRPVVSNSVQMGDGAAVSVMTDSLQWQAGTATAKFFATQYGLETAKTQPEFGFVVGTDKNPTLENATKVESTLADGGRTFSGTFTAVEDLTQYYFRAYVKNGDDVSYANIQEFGRFCVDLGLPSGTLWANINVGASSPEKDGNYYAWGETETKETYTYQNHEWYEHVKGAAWLHPEGLRHVQATKYDAASMNWGGTWMTPTSTELYELWNNTTRTLVFQNGVRGYQFKSRNNDNSIFVSLSGWRNAVLNEYINYGYMASADLRDSRNDYAYYLRTDNVYDSWWRSDAMAIRPVVKTNVTAANGEKLFIRTLPALKFYDGTTERDTLRGVVRGLDVAGSGNTLGFVYWKSDETRDDGIRIVVEPDANGHLRTVVSEGLEPGVTYCYQMFLNDGQADRFAAAADTQYFTAVGVVDLGLSVKWANLNIGAESEGGSGDYYRWGAIEPYRNETQQYSMNRDIIPESGRDIARNLWGHGYRMPTIDEMRELSENCDWKWGQRDGFNGYVITSKVEGYTDKSIFLPAAGYYYDSYHNHLNTHTYYWTATQVNNSNGYLLRSTNSTSRDFPTDHNKYHGFSVRAVQEKLAYINTHVVVRNLKGTAEVDTLVAYMAATTARTVGFQLSDNADMTNATLYTVGTLTEGTFKQPVSGLQNGKTYYYRPFVSDGTSYQYGDAYSFELIQLVDLGLKNGTLWTNINVGAGKPEDAGDYFSWGETEPKESYTVANYKYYQNGYVEIGTDIGGTQYDAATTAMGQLYRTPTHEQCRDLIDGCTWKVETVNGVQCMKFTSKTYTDRYIYLPLVGRMDNVSNDRSYGIYMPSTRYNGDQCHDFYLPTSGPGATDAGNHNYKYLGMQVRAVVETPSYVDGTEAMYHVATVGCDYEIGGTTATLHGNVTLSAPVSGATYGFIVGRIQEVETDTPATENVRTVSVKDGYNNYSLNVGHDGSAKYYRAFLEVGGKYYLGDIKSITAARLFDFGVTTDGTAFDGSNAGLPVTKYGTPAITYNSDYKRYEIDLKGNNFGVNGGCPNQYRFSFAFLTEYVNKMFDGYTIEAVMKRPVETTVNNEGNAAASADNNGGCTIGVRNRQIFSAFKFNGGWQYVQSDVQPGADVYYHVVTVYDKSMNQLRIYVDGVQHGSLNVGNTHNLPNYNWQMIVGAEPANSYGLGWDGKVVVTRLYEDALTAEQVQTLYNNLKK